MTKFLQTGHESATLRDYTLAMGELESVYKNIVAQLPTSFECGPTDDEPKWHPAWKVATTNIRLIAGEVYPAFKLFDPLLDEDNWLAGISYFTTRNRIEQWTDLNETQLDEWQSLTCNLQRHTKTLRAARLKARPSTTTTNVRNATPPKSAGKGRSIGTIAAVGVGAIGGLYAYNEYKKIDAARSAASFPAPARVGGITTPLAL